MINASNVFPQIKSSIHVISIKDLYAYDKKVSTKNHYNVSRGRGIRPAFLPYLKRFYRLNVSKYEKFFILPEVDTRFLSKVTLRITLVFANVSIKK
jgi:hypothetical protein